MKSRLFVLQDVSLNNEVYVKEKFTSNQDVSLNNRLFVKNNAQFNKNAYVNNSVSINTDDKSLPLLINKTDAIQLPKELHKNDHQQIQMMKKDTFDLIQQYNNLKYMVLI